MNASALIENEEYDVGIDVFNEQARYTHDLRASSMNNDQSLYQRSSKPVIKERPPTSHGDYLFFF